MIYHPKLKRWFRLTTQNGLTCTVSGITLVKDTVTSGGDFTYEFVDGKIRAYPPTDKTYSIFRYDYSTPQSDGLMYNPNSSNIMDASAKEFTYMVFTTFRGYSDGVTEDWMQKQFNFQESSTLSTSISCLMNFGYTTYYAGFTNEHVTAIWGISDFSNRYQPFGQLDITSYTQDQKNFFKMYHDYLTPFGVKRDGNAFTTSYSGATTGTNYKFYFVKHNSSTSGSLIKTNVFDANFGQWRNQTTSPTNRTKNFERIELGQYVGKTYGVDARDVMIFSYNMPDSDFRRLGLGLHPLSK